MDGRDKAYMQYNYTNTVNTVRNKPLDLRDEQKNKHTAVNKSIDKSETNCSVKSNVVACVFVSISFLRILTVAPFHVLVFHIAW